MHVSSIKIDSHSTQEKLINTFWSRIVERQDGKKTTAPTSCSRKHQKKKKIFVALSIKCFPQSFFYALFLYIQTILWEK